MDLRNMKVVEAQVVSDEDPSPGSVLAQFIRVEALLDMSRGQTQVSYYAASSDGARKTDQAFATAVVYYEDLKIWQAEWQMASHLVASRINAIWNATSDRQIASQANRERVSVLSQGTVYELFANIVDYGVRYRGMHRVALVEDALEATADVVLDADLHGTWNTPPHWIDSAFQLAGFIMNSFGVQSINGSDDDDRMAGSSRDFFYITPGWRHLRIAEPLESGPDVKYRNYVRMSPVAGEPGAYAGDIYLLRGSRIVGVCAGIKFKRVPRALMPIMFPQRKKGGKKTGNLSAHIYSGFNIAKPPVAAPAKPRQQGQLLVSERSPAPTPVETPQSKTAESELHPPHIDACMQLIASETGLDTDDLPDEAAFTELGVDSLMSLTLAEKIQTELGILVKASVFLECLTVKEFKNWLSKQGA
jgi:asperthecin polyketide synthase